MSAPRVLLVDDHRLLAQGLALALEHEGVEVAVAVPGDEDVMARARAFAPHVVVLDLMLGSFGESTALIAPLRRETGAQVLMLTGVTDHLALAGCLEAGALGLASKADGFDRVVGAVLAALDGRRVMPEADRVLLLTELHESRLHEEERRAPFEALTRREQEVLQGLIDGKSLHEIADESFVSFGTVRTHAKAVFRKLGVGSQIAAVAAAREAGWSLVPV